MDVIYSGDTAQVLAQQTKHKQENKKVKQIISSEPEGLLPKDVLDKAKGPT